MSLVTKNQIVPFINGNKPGTGGLAKWVQIKKGTTFTLATNPQIKTYDFISSESPEEEIVGYKPSLTQSITMFKGEDDYQAFFDMLFDRPVGGQAHRDVLLAFYQEAGTNAEDETVYKAWKVDSLVKVNQMDTVNESIDIDLAFNRIETGSVSLKTGVPVFTKGSWSGTVFTADT